VGQEDAEVSTRLKCGGQAWKCVGADLEHDRVGEGGHGPDARLDGAGATQSFSRDGEHLVGRAFRGRADRYVEEVSGERPESVEGGQLALHGGGLIGKCRTGEEEPHRDPGIGFGQRCEEVLERLCPFEEVRPCLLVIAEQRPLRRSYGARQTGSVSETLVVAGKDRSPVFTRLLGISI
jgi:hypothetical protein